MPDTHAQRRPAATARRRGVPPANRSGCTSYAAGHTIHWIQALHTANKPEVSARSWSGWLLEVAGEVLTVAREDGGTLLFRNHDPERLLAIARSLPTAVLVNDQYAILRVGSYTFSVQRDAGQPLESCPHDELPNKPTDAQLAERVATHGGFSVSVALTAGREKP